MNGGMLIFSDDFGLDVSINDGIILALKEGFIDGASLMANGDYFDDAVNKLKGLEIPNVGVHFVLVEEKALTMKNLCKNHKTFFVKYIFGLVNLEEIERELRAQLDRCFGAGVKINFLNSHQHLHLLPKILGLVIRLAKENNIEYIRTVSEPFSLKAGFFRALESVFLSFLSKMAKKKIEKAGLRTNDIFVGFLRAGNMQKEDIATALNFARKNPDKLVELGCHIGFENDKLKEKYKNWGGYHWQRELDILKNFKNG